MLINRYRIVNGRKEYYHFETEFKACKNDKKKFTELAKEEKKWWESRFDNVRKVSDD